MLEAAYWKSPEMASSVCCRHTVAKSVVRSCRHLFPTTFKARLVVGGSCCQIAQIAMILALLSLVCWPLMDSYQVIPAHVENPRTFVLLKYLLVVSGSALRGAKPSTFHFHGLTCCTSHSMAVCFDSAFI